MVNLSHVEFKVDDEGGGTDYREFSFDTYVNGSEYIVDIYFEVDGKITKKLSKSVPEVIIDSDPATRVRPSGTLKLVWTENDKAMLILFTGKLYTNHSVMLKNVCVGVVE